MKEISRDAVRDTHGQYPPITGLEVAQINPPHLISKRMADDEFLTWLADWRERHYED